MSLLDDTCGMSDPALWSAIQRRDVRGLTSQLFPTRTAVSSAILSSEVAGTGRHSIRETGPEVLGGSPVTDCGPATVGVLYPVTCAARYYDAASRILEEEGRLHRHANADELGHVIQAWIEKARNNVGPR